MTALALTIRNAVARTVAAVIFGGALVFGFDGTAQAHTTWTPPVPHSPVIRTHQGPYSVLHQGPFPVLRQGPFSVLRQVG